ncbi:hypothetical protein COCSADRAFT_230930 [Bipolaris sorokiniana ND90Pr]|uniref:HMG box domain-containing protein n=1 Tax=Cochliobolus sativus (strain ND90Pr / ATCC 201652) TaxID=665912 RepID=M2SWP1_COCSN|nr:uncharacterized protein COCSADRAFT_230930 [Bipolaris sorokiniana ND90Pr]EMD61396.1 hypothetical protein COCSADRAFT_230930 [Bipolaris sorokiniana ND90Pr]
MLAGALCRLAADIPRASPHNVPQLARHLERVLVIRSAAESSPAYASSRAYAYARAYATTTRATKPTATVKKAVKAVASEKTPPKKKAAPAKTTAKKPAANKTKKKPAAKKKVANKTKKKPAKKRVKKPLTEEEKERAKIRQLRAKALKEPVTQRTLSAYNIFISEVIKGKPSSSDDQLSKITKSTKEFKNLSPAQLEHYNHLANEQNAARKAEFEKWILNYTPQQIRIANLARTQLRKRLADKQKSLPSHTSKLHDPRHVKAALNPYALFFRDRHASGDLKGIAAPQASRLIGAEWKSLSESEKQKYQSEANALATKQ